MLAKTHRIIHFGHNWVCILQKPLPNALYLDFCVTIWSYFIAKINREKLSAFSFPSFLKALLPCCFMTATLSYPVLCIIFLMDRDLQLQQRSKNLLLTLGASEFLYQYFAQKE